MWYDTTSSSGSLPSRTSDINFLERLWSWIEGEEYGRRLGPQGAQIPRWQEEEIA